MIVSCLVIARRYLWRRCYGSWTLIGDNELGQSACGNEARRILEKFVDAYEDLSAGEALGALVKEMWTEKLPWIV
jgi:hypothetical protein